MHLNKLGKRFLRLFQENSLAFLGSDAYVCIDYLFGSVDDENESDSGVKILG